MVQQHLLVPANPPTLCLGSKSSFNVQNGPEGHCVALCHDGGGGTGFKMARGLTVSPPRYGGASVSCPASCVCSFRSRIPLTWSCVVNCHDASPIRQGMANLMLIFGRLPTRRLRLPSPPAWLEHLHFSMKARSLSNMRTDKRISAHAKANPVDPFLLHSLFSPPLSPPSIHLDTEKLRGLSGCIGSLYF
jgi:hypothetical protein